MCRVTDFIFWVLSKRVGWLYMMYGWGNKLRNRHFESKLWQKSNSKIVSVKHLNTALDWKHTVYLLQDFMIELNANNNISNFMSQDCWILQSDWSEVLTVPGLSQLLRHSRSLFSYKCVNTLYIGFKHFFIPF